MVGASLATSNSQARVEQENSLLGPGLQGAMPRIGETNVLTELFENVGQRRRRRHWWANGETQAVGLTWAVIGVLTKDYHLDLGEGSEVQGSEDFLGWRKNGMIGPFLGYEGPKLGPIGFGKLTPQDRVPVRLGHENQAYPHGVADFIEIDDPEDFQRRWRLQVDFLNSNWTCIWGRGCQGILDDPAEDLGQGCCSLGAEMFDEDEARLTSAMAAMIDSRRFQYHAEAERAGIFSDESATNTRVVDGACIFLNRPGFAGGAGCALHLEAVTNSESPTEWKPSVCWQLPIKIDWTLSADGTETATLRQWARKDWGSGGSTMAWICTDEPESYVGTNPVIDSLSEELQALMGPKLYREVRVRMGKSGEVRP